MKTAIRRISKVSLSLILMIALLLGLGYRLTVTTSGNERYFSGAAEDYYISLIDLGFPSDYAVALTELHMLHPEWTFLPLDVTGLKSTYTWRYVIEQETANPETNLIHSATTYSAYHHPSNKEKYDSGYYQASVEAVEYFMDPRNFLNEADIFLFFDLAAKEDSTQDAINAVLMGTFMENATLDNGMTYAAYFQKIGAELLVNPIYLAVKARQEQGVGGTSPVLSGACGTKLWEFYRDQTQYSDSGNQILPPATGYTKEDLIAYDGYYNFYNVGANGKGLFNIYYNAMLRAKVGTEAMKGAWGGDPSWNTQWKSIYGGAYILKQNYIDRYQSTVYLQKFNVDYRSGRNFYGQYMQSVSGGLTEARSLYQSFASIDRLDGAYTFLIPVYADMPQSPCPDPANGSCTALAQATTRYTYQAELTSPTRLSATSAPAYAEKEAFENESISLAGVMTHSYGLDELQYSWDFGEWRTMSTSNQFDFSVSADFPAHTTHILLIRGKAKYDHTISARKQNVYVLYAVIYVKVTKPPQVTLTYRVGNTEAHQMLSAGSSVTLPIERSEKFAGWIGSDGSFLPSGCEVSPLSNTTYTALFLDIKMLDGAAISTTEPQPHLRFSAILDERSYDLLRTLPDNLYSIKPMIQKGESSTLQSKKLTQIKVVKASNKAFVRLDVDTDPLTKEEYTVPHSAAVTITLLYTNGEQKNIAATSADTQRSAETVAKSALLDPTSPYTKQTIEFLKTVAGAT